MTAVKQPGGQAPDPDAQSSTLAQSIPNTRDGLGFSPPFLVVLAGPTASGKTDLSLWLAEQLNGEILCTDSMQVYRRLNIGTAKPTPAEQAQVPHHLLDRVDPDEAYSAGRYEREALEALQDLSRRGKTPILVGGTGLYYRALMYGLSDMPTIPSQTREQVAAWHTAEGTEGCWERLAELDPPSAKALHQRDTARVLRALEVVLASGRSIRSFRQAQPFEQPRFPCWVGGLHFPREELYARINDRVEQMLASGWVEEVQQLLQDYPPDLPAFRAIGYAEVTAYLHQTLDWASMVTRIQQRTRQYAKRQLTWFRRDPHFQWQAPQEREVLLAGIRAAQAAAG